MIKLKSKRFSVFVYIIGALLIWFAGIFKFGIANTPYCVSDEIGYWTSAVWLNKGDWSPIMSHSPYYGWGYGVILAPLYLIENSIDRFHVAIFLNSFMLVLIYYVVNQIIRELSTSDIKCISPFVATMSTVYSYNIVFAHTNMCETLLTFLFTVEVFCLLRLVKTRKNIWLTILIIVQFYMFSTHLRTAICLIGLIAFLGVLKLKGKISNKSFAYFAVLLFVVIIGSLYIKQLYIQKEYVSSIVENRNAGNDDAVGKIAYMANMIINKDQWINILVSFFSKVFYLVSATAGIVIVFTYGALRSMKTVILKNKVTDMDYCLTFVFLVFLGSFILDILNNSAFNRIDQVFYARYVDYVMPIVICLGYLYFINEFKEYRIRYLFYVMIITTAIGKYVYLFLKKKDFTTSINLNICWFSGWIENASIKNVELYTIVPIFITCFFITFIYLLGRKKPELVCLIVSLCWIVSGEMGWINTINPQLSRMNSVIETAQIIEGIDQNVYVSIPNDLMENPDTFVDVSWLQYHVGLKTLFEYQKDNTYVQSICVVVDNKDKAFDELTNGKEVVFSNDIFHVLIQ